MKEKCVDHEYEIQLERYELGGCIDDRMKHAHNIAVCEAAKEVVKWGIWGWRVQHLIKHLIDDILTIIGYIILIGVVLLCLYQKGPSTIRVEKRKQTEYELTKQLEREQRQQKQRVTVCDVTNEYASNVTTGYDNAEHKSLPVAYPIIHALPPPPQEYSFLPAIHNRRQSSPSREVSYSGFNGHGLYRSSTNG
jgi:hypothetical protein